MSSEHHAFADRFFSTNLRMTATIDVLMTCVTIVPLRPYCRMLQR